MMMSANWGWMLAVGLLGVVSGPTSVAAAEGGATVRVASPDEGASYAVGEIVPLVVEPTGAGDFAQSDTFQWEVTLLRDGREPVASMSAMGIRTSFVAQEGSDEPNLSYRVRLMAPADTVDVYLYPKSSFEKSRAINPGDVLQVAFYAGGERQEDFTAQVSSAGYVTSPLLGEIRVAGMTPFKVADVMRSELAERFYVNPQVLVSLKEMGGKVYVSGEVNRPGAYGLQEGLTVLKVCALAGGFTNYAALNSVKVTRYDRGGPKTFKLDLRKVRSGREEDMMLQNGDQIDVPHRRF
jgi:polysaccharide export outer membrane protein